MASEPKRQNRIKKSSEINEELKIITQKLLEIEQGVSAKTTQKKIPRGYIICQISGTLLVLLSWTIQNTVINSINSQTSNYYKTRTEMFVLEGKLAQDQLKINLFNNSHFRSTDYSVSEYFETRDAYLEYVTTLVTQMLTALSLVNIGDEIPSRPGEIMTSDLKQEIESGCRQTLNIVHAYRNPQIHIDSLQSLQLSSTLAYLPQKNDLMIIAQQSNIKKEAKRDDYNPIFIVFYSLGTLLIIISLFKEFRK